MTPQSYGKAALALALGIVSLGVALGAFAAPRSIPGSEARFLQKAAADGMAEVQLAQLARQKAMREEVRELAERMVADHTKANEEVHALAATNGVKLPAGPDEKHLKLMHKLEGLAGGDFDRAYMKHMLGDHKKDLKEFRRAARATERDDVTDFAGRAALAIQEHARMAQATYDIAYGPKRTANRETGSSRR